MCARGDTESSSAELRRREVSGQECKKDGKVDTNFAKNGIKSNLAPSSGSRVELKVLKVREVMKRVDASNDFQLFMI